MEHTLSHGPITAIIDTKGGELVSLKDSRNIEFIWQGDPKYWSGRNPHLFPVVGGLKNGGIRFDGRPYQMNRHGFARQSTFSVVEKSEDSILLQLEENESTLSLFPFRFSLRVRHQLTDHGFSTEFHVYNPGDEPLPFCIGGHTAISCPFQYGTHFEDYKLVFDDVEDAYAMIPLPTGLLSAQHREYILNKKDTLPLDYAVFDRTDTLIFEDLNSTGVSLTAPDGHGVHMDFSGFPMIAFWTAPGKQAPYICMEPWHGCAAFEDESGEFIDKKHCIILRPKEEKHLCYTVTLF